MKTIRLTPTSYIVLGLLADADGVTPYELKAMVAGGVGNLWSLQHTQVYAEPERLAGAGYLTEMREDGGRRRKLYSITPAGRAAFDRWLKPELTSDLPELRDIGLLKVFFGADPAPIAIEQLRAHREKLREYQDLEQALTAPAPDPAALDQPALDQPALEPAALDQPALDPAALDQPAPDPAAPDPAAAELPGPEPAVPDLAGLGLTGRELTGPLLTLRAGIGHEREWIRYWAGLAGEAADLPAEAADPAD